MRIILPLTAACLYGSAAFGDSKPADYLSGIALLNICDKDDTNSQIQCIGYITGVHGAVAMMERKGLNMQYCQPPELSARQIELVVIAYLKKNPADLHTAAAPNVWLAFIEAFPCHKSQ